MNAIHIVRVLSVVLAFAAALAAPERRILWSMAIVSQVTPCTRAACSHVNLSIINGYNSSLCGSSCTMSGSCLC